MCSCYRFAVVTMVLVVGSQASARAQAAAAPQPVTPIPPPAPVAPTEMPEVVVHGRAEDLLGAARSASQGSVGGADLADLPVLRRGELIEEAVPGMVVTQHSGDGKANQYFLRGFNLDHGTDFAFSVDGVPVNLPSHAHGQGYSDLNFLIPELVDENRLRKGALLCRGGRLLRRRRGQHPSGERAPRRDRQRAARSVRLRARPPGRQPRRARGPGHPALRPRIQPLRRPLGSARALQPLQRLLRYHWDHGRDSFNLTASAYSAPFWHSTDQVAQRAIDEGLIDRFGAIDPTDGGATGRAALAFDWLRNEGDSVTKLQLYGFYYRLNLWSDFTYALTCSYGEQSNCDQFEQVDRRFVTGGELKRTWARLWWGKKVENTVGLQVRNDYIPDSGLNDTIERQVVTVEIYDHIEEFNTGVYASNQVQWTRWFRSQLGLRGDVFAIDVNSNTAANSGNSTAGILSPKATLVFGPWEKTEIYLDAGSGFHSNDARGVTITVDPATQLPQGQVPAPGPDQGRRGRGAHVDRPGAGQHALALVPAVELRADLRRRLGRHRGQRPLPQVRPRVGELLQADALADALGRLRPHPRPLPDPQVAVDGQSGTTSPTRSPW